MHQYVHHIWKVLLGTVLYTAIWLSIFKGKLLHIFIQDEDCYLFEFQEITNGDNCNIGSCDKGLFDRQETLEIIEVFVSRGLSVQISKKIN